LAKNVAPLKSGYRVPNTVLVTVNIICTGISRAGVIMLATSNWKISQ
jgi:hypothetical protein